jgi:hypothetical protein
VTERLPILDASEIFRTLAEHRVDYVLIGGIAAQAHGRPVRMTNVTELTTSPEPANLARLADALNALGARVLNPGHEEDTIDATMLPRATIWQFTTRAGGIDVMHEVPGGREFAELREAALEVQLGEITVPVAGFEDLIRMKEARGRKIDLEDIAALTDEI